MSEWKLHNLGNVVDIGSSKRIFYNDYVSNGIPFYRSKIIIEKYKGNEISTELFITQEKFIKAHQGKINDISIYGQEQMKEEKILNKRISDNLGKVIM